MVPPPSQNTDRLLFSVPLFDSVPATATDVTASITDDKQLDKKYVDNKVSSLCPALSQARKYLTELVHLMGD
jgi:hypothetical protein